LFISVNGRSHVTKPGKDYLHASIYRAGHPFKNTNKRMNVTKTTTGKAV
jgi:hypothetical protein